MTDHLPECRCAKHTHAPDSWCECGILRACEQRAFEKGWDEGEEVGYDRGRTSGLMSAEAAVARLHYGSSQIDRPWFWRDDVLDAIRALKEKP